MVNYAVQMHPVEDTNHSFLTHHFKKEATFSLVITSSHVVLQGWVMEHWSVKGWRWDKALFPHATEVSRVTGTERCNVHPIQESKAASRAVSIVFNSGKCLAHAKCSTYLHLMVWIRYSVIFWTRHCARSKKKSPEKEVWRH